VAETAAEAVGMVSREQGTGNREQEQTPPVSLF
jgi:hypothetical protein